MSSSSTLRPALHPTLVALITGLFAFLLMAFYLGGELRGNLNWSILPSASYDIPAAETARSFEPLYIRKGESGWDGQFYYYISNDLLAQTDAKYKVEMAPYRYQRIGVSLVAKIASTLLGYDYVPVPVFYLTSVTLVLLASFLFASFLQARGLSPYLSLVWSLAAGTQLTMLNGLPDAGADAFLLIALTALFNKKLWLYIPAIALCILSREAYVLIPFGIALATLIDSRTKLFTKPTLLHLIKLGLPLLAFCGWQLYLKLHFADVAPISTLQEKLVTLWPLEQIILFTVNALRGQHPIFGNSQANWLEVSNLLSFCILLTGGFTFLVHFFKRDSALLSSSEKPLAFGLNGAFFALFSLYLFLGETVMRHHTGFLKVLPICFISIIFCHAAPRKKLSALSLAFLLVCLFASQPTLIDRVIKEPSTLGQYVGIYDPSFDEAALSPQAPCLDKISSEISYVRQENFYKNTFFAKLMSRPETKILTFKIKNTSTQTWPAIKNNGTTLLASYWAPANGKGLVLGGSWPTVLQKPMRVGEERLFPVVAAQPSFAGDLRLRLFISQTGCPQAENPQTNATNYSFTAN